MERNDFTIKKGIIIKKSKEYVTIRYMDGYEAVITYKGVLDVKDTVFMLKTADRTKIFKTFNETILELDNFFKENA